ncbi:Epididymal secretory glutathione peroxidase [Saguinus oedipus]|uniref:Epididymal secretory glutathione peroxidase n=1 Tax=Saguinus oedipus TaxID=9490 RepID=A0ABQ9VUU1_SAGOE|nr:Epididymal secretory glutathione peroxidase [Saguinus oedipus]
MKVDVRHLEHRLRSRDQKGTIYDYEAIMLNKKEYVPFKRYVGKHVLFVNVATYCGLTAQYPDNGGIQGEVLRNPVKTERQSLSTRSGGAPVGRAESQWDWLAFVKGRKASSLERVNQEDDYESEQTKLNALQEELKPFGLVVLGFPCNQFGKQEPGDNKEILPGLKYVRPGGGFVPNFQLFEKGDVNGEKEQKVFSFLKHACPHPSEILGTFKSISWDPVRVHDIRWNFEKFLVGPDGIPVTRWSHQATVSLVKADIVAYLKQFKTQ